MHYYLIDANMNFIHSNRRKIITGYFSDDIYEQSI